MCSRDKMTPGKKWAGQVPPPACVWSYLHTALLLTVRVSCMHTGPGIPVDKHAPHMQKFALCHMCDRCVHVTLLQSLCCVWLSVEGSKWSLVHRRGWWFLRQADQRGPIRHTDKHDLTWKRVMRRSEDRGIWFCQ